MTIKFLFLLRINTQEEIPSVAREILHFIRIRLGIFDRPENLSLAFDEDSKDVMEQPTPSPKLSAVVQ